MLKFDRSATPNQYVSTVDHPVLTFPSGNFTALIEVAFTGDMSGANLQCLLSNGPLATNGINLMMYGLGDSATGNRGKIGAFIGSTTTARIVSANTVTEGAAYVFALGRLNGDLTLRRCPILAAIPTDGSAVTLEGSAGATSVYDGAAGLFIGARGDLTSTRFSDQAFGRVARVDVYLTDFELAKIASGVDIATLGHAPAFNLKLTNLSTVVDRGPNVLPFTVTGAPTVVADPTYAPGTGTPEPEPEPTGTVSVNVAAAERIHQRINGTAPVSMSGAHTGTVPTAIEYRLYDEMGLSVLRTWASAAATIVAGGSWTAAPQVPAGGMYRAQVRALGAGGVVLATSTLSPTLFGVGDLHAWLGSSSAEKMFQDYSGTGFTPGANVRVFDGAWARFGTDGAAILMANSLAQQASVPIGLLDYGVGGTTLLQWINQSNSSWTAFAAGVTNAGGKLACASITVGSNDTAASSVVSRAAHLENLRTLNANVRALTGQPTLHIMHSGMNRRNVSATQVNYVRMAENDLGDDANVTHVVTIDYPLASDAVHLTPEGYTSSAGRMSAVLGRRLYGDGTYWRGPKLVAAAVSGTALTVQLQHRGGSSFTPTSAITGFAAADDSGSLTLSNVAQAGGNVVSATLNRAPVGDLKLSYFATANPSVTAIVVDNGTPPIPMHPAQDIVATAGIVQPESDITAPVLGGVVTVGSTITDTTASISCQVATDAVGVAGYEYSINGGTSYTLIAGGARAVSLTGLTPETTYPVRMRAFDSAGNKSAAVSGSFTTQAAIPPADTTAPVMVGSITVTGISKTGATLSWAAATDAVGVAGYEYSINGGTTYINVGTARSVAVTGRPAGTAHSVRARAYDLAGNRATPLAGSFSTLADQPPGQDSTDGTKVSAARKVVFPGGTRIVAFGSQPIGVTPNAPYFQGGKWWDHKHPLDQRYWVADVAIDLAARSTTAVSVVALVAGVTVVEQPVIQGSLIPIKLGSFNAAVNAINFCTFRITCANGERFDRTIWFLQQVGQWLLEKDPDDESYYVADVGYDLADSNTSATAVLALPVGVAVLSPAVIQGSLIVVKLGGMDSSPDPVNYCELRIDCANSERFYRTIHFNRVDN